MDRFVSINSVEKSFTDNDGNSRRVLSGVSLDIEEGALAILRGRSGSGKSTLLNIIAGLYLADSGDVTIGNTKINALSEARRDSFRAMNIGYIFQTFNLISALTVAENIYMPAILTNSSPNRDYKKKALEILDKMEIVEHAYKYPWQLSVGQRQRVAIGRALFKKQKLILADDPSASLDKSSAEIVIKSLLELKKSGTTLIIATHDSAFDNLSPETIYNIEGSEVES